MNTLADAWKWYEATKRNLARMQRLGSRHWSDPSLESTSIWQDDYFKRVEAQDILKDGFYPDGDSIANHLGEATRARLVEYAKAGQLGADYTRAKPWLLSLMIVQLQLQQMGFDPSKGLDQHFVREARQMHKAIAGLETADSQLRLFSSFSQ